jgi:SagB-type dehydrogenase family enzyme
MRREHPMRNKVPAVLCGLMAAGFVLASPLSAEQKDLPLPVRPASVGMDLVTALEQRKSTREYSTARISSEDLSAILWAANGVNRPGGKRTAPSAYGNQYIEVYVVADAGSYLYDSSDHRLKWVSDGDLRGKMGRQGYVSKASHILVLVADLGRVPGPLRNREEKLYWANSTAGTIAQNIYLMAASRGIGTCIVAGLNEENIRQAFKLPGNLVPLYIMPLGYQQK